MTCAEFLARYSDYIDGDLGAYDAARAGAHLSTCSRCARYDRVTRRGLELVRDLPAVEPSVDFNRVLRDRLRNDEFGFDRAAPAVGVIFSLMVAILIGVIAWSPLLQREVSGPVELDVTSAAEVRTMEPPTSATQPLDASFAGGLGGFWSTPGARGVATYPVRHQPVPGAYSPVPVAEPVFRKGEAVLLMNPLE